MKHRSTRSAAVLAVLFGLFALIAAGFVPCPAARGRRQAAPMARRRGRPSPARAPRRDRGRRAPRRAADRHRSQGEADHDLPPGDAGPPSGRRRRRPEPGHGRGVRHQGQVHERLGHQPLRFAPPGDHEAGHLLVARPGHPVHGRPDDAPRRPRGRRRERGRFRVGGGADPARGRGQLRVPGRAARGPGRLRPDPAAALGARPQLGQLGPGRAEAGPDRPAVPPEAVDRDRRRPGHRGRALQAGGPRPGRTAPRPAQVRRLRRPLVHGLGRHGRLVRRAERIAALLRRNRYAQGPGAHRGRARHVLQDPGPGRVRPEGHPLRLDPDRDRRLPAAPGPGRPGQPLRRLQGQVDATGGHARGDRDRLPLHRHQHRPRRRDPGVPRLALQLQSRHPGHPPAGRRPGRRPRQPRPPPRRRASCSSSIRPCRRRRSAGCPTTCRTTPACWWPAGAASSCASPAPRPRATSSTARASSR